MAVFNELLVGRFNRALQKLTSIKGPPPVRQLGTEILPVFSMPLGVEFRYLEGWNRYGISVAPGAGGAGNNSAMRFRNPVGSNVIVVFENITFFDNAVGIQSMSLEGWVPTSTDLGTILSGFISNFDSRSGFANSTVVVSQQSNAALPLLGFQVALHNVTTDQNDQHLINNENQELTLLPGLAMQIRNPNVNQACSAYVWWRERFLEDSERT